MVSQNDIDRDKRLEEVEKELAQRLRIPVKGILRVSRVSGTYRYYIRGSSEDRLGKYVDKENMKKAEMLAQREFDLDVQKRICAERKLRKECGEMLERWPWEAAADALSPGKRELVVMPDSDKEYAAWWRSQKQGPQECDPEASGPLYSGGKDKMRSKSEIIISKILEERGIPYIYELPLYLEPNHLYHPDFTLLRVRDRREIIWEHLGMMSDPEYREAAFKKIRVYESNGYISGDNLLITFESETCPIDLDAVNLKLDRMFGSKSER